MSNDRIEILRVKLSNEMGITITTEQAKAAYDITQKYMVEKENMKTDDEIYNEGIDAGVKLGKNYGVEYAVALLKLAKLVE